jgi:hypothetical protein
MPLTIGEAMHAPASSFLRNANLIQLFEDKGGRLTIWPPAIANAGLLDRSSLAEKLRALLHALEG